MIAYSSDTNETQPSARPDNEPKSSELTTLADSVEWSRRKLENFQRKHYNFIKNTVGAHYSLDGAEDRIPLNMAHMATSTLMAHLASETPKVLVTTNKNDLKPHAYEFELGLNQLFKEINFRSTQNDVVLDHLFTMGIGKVGMAISGEVEVGGVLHDAGQPYYDQISIDDWVMDMSVKRYEQVSYAGHFYDAPYEWVMDSGLFENTAGLYPSRRGDFQERGNPKAETIGRGLGGGSNDTYYDDVVPKIRLLELWLPFESSIITLAVSEEGEVLRSREPLRYVDWEGPERGPFHLLRAYPVADNLMPMSPMMVWYDLHILANRLFNKTARQAERQKKIGVVKRAHTRDGERVIKTSDGEMIPVDDTKGAMEMSLGGIDQSNFAFILQNKELFSHYAGGIDILAGLGPQAPTLGQDQLLDQNASKMVNHLQKGVVQYTKNVVEDLAYWMWNDPVAQYGVTKKVEGTSVEIPTSWSQDKQEGDLLDYAFDIEPYSMQHQTPGTRMQSLMNFMQNVLMPLTPQMEAQGIQINFESLIKTMGHYTALENELADIVIFATPEEEPGMGEGSTGERPTQSPNTNRTYTRRSEARPDNEGDTNDMVAKLMSGGSQDTGA